MDNEITVPSSLAFPLGSIGFIDKEISMVIRRRDENDLDLVEKSASKCKRSKSERCFHKEGSCGERGYRQDHSFETDAH